MCQKRNLQRLDESINGQELVLLPKEAKRYRHFGLMFNKTRIEGTAIDEWLISGENEWGLSGFVVIDDKAYHATSIRSGRTNIAPYEFLTWLLDQFKSVDEVERELYRIHLVLTQSTCLPVNLAYVLTDHKRRVLLKSTVDGIELITI